MAREKARTSTTEIRGDGRIFQQDKAQIEKGETEKP
jgi:hypothetical protein